MDALTVSSVTDVVDGVSVELGTNFSTIANCGNKRAGLAVVVSFESDAEAFEPSLSVIDGIVVVVTAKRLTVAFHQAY